MTFLIVHKTQLVAIGLVVEVPLRKPSQVMPAAWQSFFARQHELPGRFQALNVRLGANGDVAYEFVGALVPMELEPPPGMRRLMVPANQYIRAIHNGPLAGIAAGFGGLLDELKARDLKDAGIRLDIGYTPGLPAGRHELYVGIARFMPPQLGPVIEAASDESRDAAVEQDAESPQDPTG
jgi:predicted transcriptional regulator YdeE